MFCFSIIDQTCRSFHYFSKCSNWSILFPNVGSLSNGNCCWTESAYAQTKSEFAVRFSWFVIWSTCRRIVLLQRSFCFWRNVFLYKTNMSITNQHNAISTWFNVATICSIVRCRAWSSNHFRARLFDEIITSTSSFCF